MSHTQKVGVVVACICWVAGLSADLHWWTPRVVPVLSGFVDSHNVAMNRHGRAIAMFDDRIFASYDVASDRWEFCELDFSADTIGLKAIQNKVSSFSSTFSRGAKIALNDRNQGVAIFNIVEGVHQCKVVCLSYSDHGWGLITVLSDEKAKVPIIAQSTEGRAVAIWIHQGEGDTKNYLMGAHYNGSSWSKQEVLSSYKSVTIDYTQSGPQIGMNELGDAIVVWNAPSEEDAKEGLIVASYFDVFGESWISGQVIAKQSLGKKGLAMGVNKLGDVLVVWDSAQCIEASRCNLVERIIADMSLKASSLLPNKKSLPQSEDVWVKAFLAQGEGLRTPKVCVNGQGDGVAIWSNADQGVDSAYFHRESNAWSRMAQLASKSTYETTLQMGTNGKGYAFWIGERENLNEGIFSSRFDFSARTWDTAQVLSGTQDGLISHLEAVSIAKENYGMVIWFDFFKEQLFLLF